MDGSKLRELYATEARDNVGALGRALLALESGDARAATDAAFRAAHNLKALAASVGDTASARLAHALEDRLARLRDGAGERPDVDALLAQTDALEASIARGIEAARTAGPAGAQAVRRLRVQLRPDTPLAAARAELVRRAVDRLGALAGSEPASFDGEFDGAFTLLVNADADADAVIAAVRGAGDVGAAEWEVEAPAARQAEPAPAGAAQPAGPRAASGATDVNGGGNGGKPIRIAPALLDAISDGVTELAVLQARLGAGPAVVDRMRSVIAALQEAVLEARMVPIGEAVERFPRLVREAARAVGKQVEFRVEGEDVRLDRAILDAIVEPLTHLLRNAIDHGIETPAEREAAGKPPAGQLSLRAERLRSTLRIEVSDDGRGIDRAAAAARGGRPADTEISDDELLRILSQPGFSLAGRVTELSGRGVGLDVVVERVRSLGGVLTLRTEAGRGTRFTLRLPLTLAVTQALRVRVGNDDYAIPLTHIAEVIDLRDVLTVSSTGREAVRLRGELLPLVRLRRLLGLADAGAEAAAVVAEIGEARTVLAVDALVAREQVVVRPFDAPAGAPHWFAGATLLADGRPVLILDPASVS